MYPPILSICFRSLRFFLVSVLVFGGVKEGWGQDMVRKYATRQKVTAGLLTSVDNPENATDQNPKTYSTLNSVLAVGNLITVTQFLEFSETYQAGKPVSIKLTFPKSVLSFLGGVQIQPFTNLRNTAIIGENWVADAAGMSYTGNTLVNLLNGAGEMEITVVPQTSTGTPVAYKGVWVRLQGVAIGQSIDLFHAYILEETSTSLSCDERNLAFDILSGVRAGLAGIANATGFINNPWNAIDNNETTYAEINTGVQLLSEIYHTTIFQTPSSPGDIVKIILQDPGANLLELDLLQGFTIQPYLRNTPVGAPITSASNLLSLKLLGGAGNKYALNVPIIGTFDRVEIKMGGVADALSVLRVYEISRETGPPTFSGIELGDDGIPYYTTCSGSAVTLSVQDPIDGLVYQWFANQTGGSPLYTGTEYHIPTITNTTTYYVQAVYGNCSPSERVPIRVVVNAVPNASNIALFINKPCDGGTASFLISPFNSAYTYYWFDVPNGGTALETGTSFSVGPIAYGETHNYYIEVVDNETGCKSTIRYPFIVDAYPPPQIAISPLAPICEGETTASIIYTTANNPTSYSVTWKENPSDFPVVTDRPLPITGPIELTIPATAAPTSYFGEIRVKTANGCISEIVSFKLDIYPKTGKPHLTITDVQN